MAEYNDLLTLDGRVRPQAGVSKRKLEAVSGLMERALRGDRIAAGTLQEVMTTSDAPFSAAHLVTAEVIAQFDEAPRTWSQIATVRTVPDFRPVQLYSIFNNGLTGPAVREGGGAARVPEAAPYPYVTVTGKEAFYQKLAKSGAKFGVTWEQQINDVEGLWASMPQQLIELALDSEESEVYDALIEGVAAAGDSVELQGGTLPDGSVVPANSTITPDAIWQAIIELSQRQVNGRSVGRLSGYNIIVPVGVGEFLRWKLSQAIIAIQDGSITFGPGDRSVFGSIDIVESDKIGLTNPNEWYVLPKPGAYRRPLLELLRLRGYEQPEIRVQNAAGSYLGGGQVSPFEGSFDNDTLDLRLRYVIGGAMWSVDGVIYSTGANAPATP